MLFAIPNETAGQIAGFFALALCVVAFANKSDDRLLAILILGNVAFALQFAFFGAWVGYFISGIIILRIILARRYERSVPAMLAILLATACAAALGWQGSVDLFPLLAGLCGTYGMFMLRGIPLRLCLSFAAVCWIVANALIGSMGALAAEVLMLIANLVTIARMARHLPRATSTLKAERSADR